MSLLPPDSVNARTRRQMKNLMKPKKNGDGQMYSSMKINKTVFLTQKTKYLFL